VVTGKGKDVPWEDGYWLGKAANEGQGSHIPTRIADKLRGQKFNNFNVFREMFWTEISNDPVLSKQFNRNNLKKLRKGKAPAARKDYHYGEIFRFEIHHIDEVNKGGDVYNIDNLRVVTRNTTRRYITERRNR
ncbi:HNH endonuclease signature motif containing protein, partial [Photobacterium sp. 1_MG-2023]|uniref:HNH endonuclease signature motif containing protein n=1 Tax=Photobacterium sp. 1_MG-2023 TaxID=3062646 RepID=UPI0026E1D9D6